MKKLNENQNYTVLGFLGSPCLSQALKCRDQNAWSQALGRMVKQPLGDVMCPLIYIDSFTVTSTLSAFMYSVCLCDRALSWLTYSVFTLLSFLWNPGIIAGNQTNKETKTKKKRRERNYKPLIFSFFLLLWETVCHNSVQWNTKRNQVEFLGRFCFLDIDIALSSFWPFLSHSWKLHMMTGTGAATLRH